jgi:hypothetical protein
MANRNTKRHNNEAKKARAQQRWFALLRKDSDKHKVTVRKSK